MKQLFQSIYRQIIKSDPAITEVWCKPSKIDYLRTCDEYEAKELISSLDFISMERGNYIDYLVINKILFVIRSVKYLQLDITCLSNLLDYQGFEALIKTILSECGYYSTKNYRFTDRSNLRSKTKQSRYEIDVIGIDRNIVLLIDCKQWKHKDSYSAMNKAANLQYRRALALSSNQETLSELVQSLIGIKSIKKVNLPLLLIPLIITLECNWVNINENSVPIVGIYRLNSFLQELPNNLYHFKAVKVNKIHIQKQLL